MTGILLDQVERSRRNYVTKATAAGNRTLNKRTGRNERSVIHRLGYNTITATYSQSSDISGLSGSSLNRSFAKQKRDENFAILKAREEATAKYRKADYEFLQSLREIESLREIAARKRGSKKRVPEKPVKRGDSLRFFSQRSKGKVRDKCTALYRCLGKQKTFATLTFISDVTDSIGVKLLNKFLTALRDRYGRIHYIYIAERQLLTTNRIHFHLIINKFLPVREINALWVLQQYNEGIEYEGISREQVVSWIQYDRENPKEKSELQKRLNPFDVEKIRGIHGLSYYLTKYITKGNNSGGFGCSVWHCSRVVSRLFTKTVVSRSTFAAASSYVNCNLDKKTGEIRKNPGKHEKYYSLFYIENKPYFLPDMQKLEFINFAMTEGMNLGNMLYYDDTGKPIINSN
jgi:hypothetical protein